MFEGTFRKFNYLGFDGPKGTWSILHGFRFGSLTLAQWVTWYCFPRSDGKFIVWSSAKTSAWTILTYCIRFCCSAYAWIIIELSTTMTQKTTKMKIDPFLMDKGVIVDWTITYQNHLRSEKFPLHSISSIYCFYTYRFRPGSQKTTAKARIFQDSQYYTEYRSKLHLAHL